ncbi:hypothetical protein B0H16DRAFT_91149 [Mycena metata]|uniref:Uncharacterized protein n=1 Tax=Mycena metata TaxID=1033252 RepID=A0AAD7MZ49_9AGAR|nr:hypothetical protein B0H16DRAFT_91149 [Mycena metata]
MTVNRSSRPKTISMPDLRFVQNVIANTTTPSWVYHVPRNFGEKGAGTPKADEWRLMSTIYLPIALTLLWAEMTGDHTAHFSPLLDHSMAIFQAITIACRYTLSSARAMAYRVFLQQWLGDLHGLYPRMKTPRTVTNPHVALHIYDFMLLFGPVLSWWAFPTERLIGELGKVNSNDHLGGQHEATLLNTWIRGANLRRWINRPNCPAALLEFYRLFTVVLGIKLGDKPEAGRTDTKTADSSPANYHYDGVQYSRSGKHLGNSLVIYLQSSGKIDAGSIEEIVVDKQQEGVFKVRRQAPLPEGKNDPFMRFPHFPAKRTRQQ